MLQFRLKFLYLLVFCDTIEIKFCAFYQGPTVENWVKRIEVPSLHKRNKYQWASVINKQIQKFQIFWENTCFYTYRYNVLTHTQDQTQLTQHMTRMRLQIQIVNIIRSDRWQCDTWHCVRGQPRMTCTLLCTSSSIYYQQRLRLLSRAGEEGWRLSPQCPVLSARHVTLLSPGTCLGLSLVHYPPVPLWLVKPVRQFWPAKKILLRKKEGIKHQTQSF